MPARTLLLPSNELVPSVILRKMAAAGAGNALSRALRALGRIERTQFTLQWLSDPALRQRSHAGLNKGEASNALRRAVFFHRQGEIKDRTFENQSFRASGLSLITAAIVHWNTVYLDRAVRQLRARGAAISDDLLAHVAARVGTHRPDRRLRLDRVRPRCSVSADTRCSGHVPAPLAA
jgi:TnpA family transposase